MNFTIWNSWMKYYWKLFCPQLTLTSTTLFHVLTLTSATLFNFMYLLNLWLKMEEELIFIHNLKIGFNYEYSTITPSTLWAIVNLKNDVGTSSKCEFIDSKVLVAIQKVALITPKHIRMNCAKCTPYYGYTMSRTFVNPRLGNCLWVHSR